jgi:acyl-CoA reductase-like NAD-dependent aldehyde dehydrogenase
VAQRLDRAEAMRRVAEAIDGRRDEMAHTVALDRGGQAGSASGVGRVGGRFSIERLTEPKTIVVNLG